MQELLEAERSLGVQARVCLVAGRVMFELVAGQQNHQREEEAACPEGNRAGNGAARRRWVGGEQRSDWPAPVFPRLPPASAQRASFTGVTCSR